MLTTRTSRRWVALIGGIVAGGVLAGAVIAARFSGSGVPADLRAALGSEPLVRVADLPAANGLAKRGVFVQPTSAGFLCLWDAASASSPARQGGCNPSDEPFAGHELFASFAYEGGPAVADVRDARLIGLVAPRVASVHVLMSDGTRRSLPLHAAIVRGGTYRVFAHRFTKPDLESGRAPTAIVALDESGAEIDRQETGFVN